MKLGDFHCRSVDLAFGISANDVNKDALLEAVGGFEEEGDSELALIFSSRDNPEDHHSHIQIAFEPDDDVQVRISFHDSRGEVDKDDEVKPPYMEECVRWLGEFIKPDEITMGLTAFYVFGEGFAPSIPVPYPLLNSDKILSGSMVTGLALRFPPESLFDHALIQIVDEKFGISVGAHDKITMKEFDLYEELKKLKPTIMALTRKMEQSDETRSEK